MRACVGRRRWWGGRRAVGVREQHACKRAGRARLLPCLLLGVLLGGVHRDQRLVLCGDGVACTA